MTASFILFPSYFSCVTFADNSSSSTKNTESTINTYDEPSSVPDYNTPSGDGFWLLLGWVRGFVQQPQSSQNIVLGNKPDLKATITSSYGFLGASPTPMEVRRWSYNNGSWVLDETKTFKAATSIRNGWKVTFNASDYITTPSTPGTYYYQIDGQDNYVGKIYSQPAKVVVTPQDVHTTGLSIQAEPVTFANNDIQYNVNSLLTPTDSTDPVDWSNSTYTNFTPQSGLSTKMTINSGFYDGQATPNSDTNRPGYTLGIYAQSNGIVGNTTTSVGGLTAKQTNNNQTTSWALQGVDLLQRINEGIANNISYHWTFFDSNGNAIDQSQLDGVKNINGDLSNFNDINNINNILTISSGQFMNKANIATESEKPYSAQVELDYQLTSGSNSRDISILSNKAYLFVNDTPLSLDTVPNFNFGNIKLKDIYNGIFNKNSDNDDNQIIVTSGSTDQWNLSVSRNPFFDDKKVQIKGSILTIKFNNNGIDIPDNNANTTVINSSGNKNYQVTSLLNSKANNNLNITDGDIFNSDLTWTLSGTVPSSALSK